MLNTGSPFDDQQKNTVYAPSQTDEGTTKVLRNTYLLLSMTIAFSAFTAYIAYATNAQPLNVFLNIAIYIGLLFLVHATATTAFGIVATFMLTGYLGYFLGPLLSHVAAMPGGSGVIMNALTLTGVIFFSLSGYVLATKKDMSFMGGFLVVGFWLLLFAIIASLFFDLSAFHLVICAMITVLNSAFLLYQTSEIIHGGENNYIRATVGIYVSLFNIFLSLLQILAAFNSDE